MQQNPQQRCNQFETIYNFFFLQLKLWSIQNLAIIANLAFAAFSEGGVGETALWHPKSGFPHTFTLIPDFFLAFSPERCYDYRETRRWDTAAGVPERELPGGARQREHAVIRPGAGGDEPPGSAPYSARERRGFPAQAGWQRGKLPSQWLGLEDFFIPRKNA